MLRKLTGHEQDVLATLVQHMGNPLDEFDMAVANRIEELVHEGNYRKMHTAGTAAGKPRQRSWLKRAKEQGFLTISVTIAKSLP